MWECAAIAGRAITACAGTNRLIASQSIRGSRRASLLAIGTRVIHQPEMGGKP